MPIKICSVVDMPQAAEGQDYIISILDPNKFRNFQKLHDNHIIVRFEDTEHPDEQELEQMTKEVKLALIWATVVKKIDPIKDKLLIHCHAGVSRSAAIAWLLLVHSGMDKQKAFQQLYINRPQIDPNTTVIGIGDSLLKTNLFHFATLVEAELSAKRCDYLGYGG
jgi:predicted protein tyrosine phosphatase